MLHDPREWLPLGDTHLDDCANSSNDHDSMDVHASNEELFEFCENLLSKYKVLKNKSFNLKNENELFSKLDLILKEKVEISSERDSLKTQLDFVLKKIRF